MVSYKLNFQTSYNQFYISSDYGKSALSGNLSLTKDAYNNRLGVYDKMIAVYPESYGHIKGDLYVLESANDIFNVESDHIVEGGLVVDSGLIQLLDCPNSAVELEIKVKPGNYKVRVYFSNLKGYDSDEEESDDYYKIEIWPGDDFERNVLKQYPRLFPA